MSPKSDLKLFGPESEFFHKLKGQQVKIWSHHEEGCMKGKLLWVDRYSLGVRLNPTLEEESKDVLIYKSGIAIIERGEYENINGDETTNEQRQSNSTAK